MRMAAGAQTMERIVKDGNASALHSLRVELKYD